MFKWFGVLKALTKIYDELRLIRRGYFMFLEQEHGITVPDEKLMKKGDRIQVSYSSEEPTEEPQWEGLEEEQEWK